MSSERLGFGTKYLKFYVYWRFPLSFFFSVVGIIRALADASTSNVLGLPVFWILLCVDIGVLVFRIIVYSYMRKMTMTGYRLNNTLLIVETFYLAITRSLNILVDTYYSLIIPFIIFFLIAILFWWLPNNIYFRHRRYMFMDDKGESNSSSMWSAEQRFKPIYPLQQASFAYCYNCGKKLMPDAKYCHSCGATLPTMTVKTEVNPASTQSAIKSEAEDESGAVVRVVEAGAEEDFEDQFKQSAFTMRTEKETYSAAQHRRVSYESQHTRQHGKKASTIGWLIAIVITVSLYFIFTNTSSRKMAVASPSPSSEAVTINVANGQMLLFPGYELDCPLTVSVPSGTNDYYIYLKYQYATKSFYGRTQLGFRNGDDIAFYVKAGKTASIDVPVGVYKIYYAYGEGWQGREKLFGPNTRFFTSDDLLRFYTDETHVYGHTLELWLQTDGNFDSDEIPASQFPG